ncbi:MAG: hypothetical protein HYW23_01135 [Candidatus Aenigmarchaeota archaeon]|nr:hypothetical protein [Candidatus Aenigmarchaeota archaeon]
MAKGKAKLVKKYRFLLKKNNAKEPEIREVDRKLSEDVAESEEGLYIEKEEDAGEEPYPEIEEDLGHEDNSEEE